MLDHKLPTMGGAEATGRGGFKWRPDMLPKLRDYVADFANAGIKALEADKGRHASRLIIFRVYYLGGAEYAAARSLIGISETTWATWDADLKWRTGKELLRRGVFPPGKYFREPIEEE